MTDTLTDRKSTVQAGFVEIACDLDHKGSFRGQQVMIPQKYRGWHYHVTSSLLDQQELLSLLEIYLETVLNAERYKPAYYAIGNCEASPAKVSAWQKGKATCILWVSKVTGSLHIEPNKDKPYTTTLINKKELITYFSKIKDMSLLDLQVCIYSWRFWQWARSAIGRNDLWLTQFCYHSNGIFLDKQGECSVYLVWQKWDKDLREGREP